jgi:hypothetical protein
MGFCGRRARLALEEDAEQTCALCCSLPGWPDPRPVRIRAQDCLPRAYAHHMMSATASAAGRFLMPR